MICLSERRPLRDRLLLALSGYFWRSLFDEQVLDDTQLCTFFAY